MVALKMVHASILDVDEYDNHKMEVNKQRDDYKNDQCSRYTWNSAKEWHITIFPRLPLLPKPPRLVSRADEDDEDNDCPKPIWQWNGGDGEGWKLKSGYP